MEIQGEKTSATFKRRLTRFSALVEIDGHEETVHLPNSGRMTELLVPGRPALLVKRASPLRKTTYDMTLVSFRAESSGRGLTPKPHDEVMEDLWVSVDSRIPNRLVEEALKERKLAPFQGYPIIRREVFYRGSRLDFLLEGEEETNVEPLTMDEGTWARAPIKNDSGVKRCFLEAKSVNLVVDGVALFPDAPTQRGTRHLRTLVEAKHQDYEAAVIFVIQRHDAQAFSPHQEADPQFAMALREAASVGVGIYAYRCSVSPQEMTLGDPVPVLLTI